MLGRTRSTLEPNRRRADGLTLVTAIDAIAERRPDVVVLDVSMPGLTGLDVLERINHSTTHSHVPVVLVTAQAYDQQVADGFAAGATDYVVKPFSPRDLVGRIETVLAHA